MTFPAISVMKNYFCVVDNLKSCQPTAQQETIKERSYRNKDKIALCDFQIEFVSSSWLNNNIT